MAIHLDAHELIVFGDSDLLIRQAQGEWETRDIKLIPYKQYLEDLSKRFKSIEFIYIPRFHNELADALATLASMLPYPGNSYINPLEIQIRDQHGYCNTIEVEPNAWGIDVIGPIEPKASNGHRFILVAIDYFTKWVEVVTFKSVTKKAVVDFVHSNIICRFGIPKTIITDNAANLNSDLMKEVCEQFKIVHHNSSPYRPKANGVVEAANKNIKKILRKMVQGSRKRQEKLPFALLGYRTTIRTFVGATPYLLVYGIEAVIPAEVEIPSLRIIVEAEIDDTEWVKSRLEQLSLIDEKRLTAVCFGQLYRQRMARIYDKKVSPRHFEVGQLVMKRILPHQEEARGKFAPNWQGPYVIKQVLSKGALQLSDIEGKVADIAINTDSVKRYYV
ncbi:uncharacterized protein LOC132629021 [Lycium barbarum]|uniref:uncharacterized protein LOC132629021 n=1 Tax=Lycium barbarum TaxID=112863 RepID=UPI00293E1332|nr:uncharacterized protein LOC132629021 [Lycium barbarum]